MVQNATGEVIDTFPPRRFPLDDSHTPDTRSSWLIATFEDAHIAPSSRQRRSLKRCFSAGRELAPPHDALIRHLGLAAGVDAGPWR